MEYCCANIYDLTQKFALQFPAFSILITRIKSCMNSPVKIKPVFHRSFPVLPQIEIKEIFL